MWRERAWAIARVLVPEPTRWPNASTRAMTGGISCRRCRSRPQWPPRSPSRPCASPTWAASGPPRWQLLKPVRGRGGLPGDARTESAAWRAGDTRSAGGDAARLAHTMISAVRGLALCSTGAGEKWTANVLHLHGTISGPTATPLPPQTQTPLRP